MNYIAGQNNTIDTGEVYFNEIEKTNLSGRKLAVKFLQRDSVLNRPVVDAKPLEARIEYSRYLVDCPNCNSAEFAFEDKLFFCSQCKNSDIQGKARKVKMPKERKEIETILLKRSIKNRHWYPNETLQDLEKQNLKMEGI
jgi:Zn finger protein HypA/HybF involved in hydrogenase expression